MLNKILFYIFCTFFTTSIFAQQKLEKRDAEITIRNGEELYINQSLFNHSESIVFKINDKKSVEFSKTILFPDDDSAFYIISFYDQEDKLSNYEYFNTEEDYKDLALTHNDLIEILDSNYNKIGVIHYKNKSKVREEKVNEDKKLKNSEVAEKHDTLQPNEIMVSLNVSEKFKKGENILADARFLLDPDQEISDKTTMLKMYNISNTASAFFKHLNFSIPNNDPGRYNLSNIAKTDVTNFATGMARFLAERAKQELNETFFIQMHKQMQKLPELQVYFPQSYKFLKHLNANTMSFDLEYLKSRFELDIKFLPKHILVSIDEADENKYPYFKTANQYFNQNVNGLWLNIGLHSVLNSNGNINPKDLLYHFVHSKDKDKKSLLLNLESKLNAYSNKTQINLINSIKLAELVSNSLLSPETGRYWVSSKEINELISNEKLFQTYIGLLLAKSDFDEYKIQFYGANDAKDYKNQSNNSLKSIVEGNFTKDGKVGDITDLKNLISDIYQTYHNVEEKVNGFKNIKNERELAEKSYDAFSLVKTSVSTIKDLVSNKSYLGTKDIKIDESVLTNYIDPTVEIAYNLFNKKYNVAIKNFIYILNQVPSVSKVISDYDLVNLVESVDFDDTRNLNRDKLMITFLKQKDVRQSLIASEIFTNEQIESFINNDSISKTDLENIVKSKEKDIIIFLDNNKDVQNYFKKRDKEQSNFLSKFNTYGTLIANVATAQNSDEVKAAIEAAVLPVGSSRIKRYSDWALTANAYVGGFYGNAYYKVNNSTNRVATFGVIAPIGVTVSKGKLNFLGKNNTLSLNVQLIDLGSLVNFYYREGDGAQLPKDTKIQLGDILAPGASLSYSLWDTPISLFTGIQYVPNLSRMESISTNNDFRPLTWRWSVGIAIDIPLFVIRKW